MSGPVLSRELRDGVATLTLNRPEKRNALGRELVDALRSALRETARQAEVRVVLLRGAEPDFCAGADLGEVERSAGRGAVASLEDASSLGRLFTDLRHHPRPVVAAVQGRALAGGCGLATACDLVLAREDAELGYPEIRIGFVPAMVMAMLRRKVGESTAFDLVATGRRISAAEAERLGLVNRLFSAAAFEEGVSTFAGELASRPREALALSKRLLYRLDGSSLEDGVARGAEVNALARTTDAFREGVRRFLERKREGGGESVGGDGVPRP